ncbi:hypothetical protein PYH37_004293 [Sinorhizobium numidicum]|uniref:Uncharacterized protein n=1 Tax=Sinorhizobium numidicum TaxID=680248 RepID=A0ABY8CVL8_9HYPH|nr:hypothetical protein [Sinorhizobium numidicum]WEX76026.1 hypothetical protein PYH37_004293 [Sinorhizobium numidicum]WEX82685.1 hypothetical protein PYH38_005005 [Sinorhizobium numidicum]
MNDLEAAYNPVGLFCLQRLGGKLVVANISIASGQLLATFNEICPYMCASVLRAHKDKMERQRANDVIQALARMTCDTASNMSGEFLL